MTVGTERSLPQSLNVLDHGFVRLDGEMANDLSVVNAARVSFAKRKDVVEKEDEGLIRFLMKNRHGTPFEHNAFRFHVKCPIFVAREWFRHRIGSFNEFSMRYATPQDEAYVPDVKDVRTQVGKPGAYSFESLPEDDAEFTLLQLRDIYRICFSRYHFLREAGVAREIARLVLPMGTYTEFYWTVNARSLMNFLSLRNSEHAQREIRYYAVAVEELFGGEMPLTWGAFVEGGRVAP